MKEKPILFSKSMIQAIIEGRKTQTRRIKKSEKCPWEVGQKLWVRETWCEFDGMPYYMAEERYKEEDVDKWRWKPSIFMPKKYSRIWLKVTNIRCEKIQDIDEEDSKKEGAKMAYWYTKPNGEDISFNDTTKSEYRIGFANLWDSINAKRGYGWEKNLEVWVIEFKKIKG